jgi:hypothetical protein
MKSTIIIAAFVVTGLSFSLAAVQTPDKARKDAFALVQSVIGSPQGPGGRLPEFLTWSTRAEMKNCPTNRDHSSQLTTARVDTRPSAHVMRTNSATPGNFDGFGFYYDAAAEKRLCSPVLLSDLSTPVVFEPKVSSWFKMQLQTQSNPPSAISPFDAGTRAAAVFWNVIPRPARPGAVSVTLNGRKDDAKTQPMIPININIPQAALDHPPKCKDPLSQVEPSAVPASQPMRELNDFYWIQLEQADQKNQGNCGDFLYLTGFHLIQKQADGRWLWSTFWWDPNDTLFPTGSLGKLTGAGPNPVAWQNYAMDAAYGTDKNIFNPWRESNNSNCEFCHRHAVIPTDIAPPGRGKPKAFSIKVLSFDGIFAGVRVQPG